MNVSNRREKKHYIYLSLLAISIVFTLAVPLVLGGLNQFQLLGRLSKIIMTGLAGMIIVSWFFNAVRLKLLMRAMDRRIGFFEGAVMTISAEFAGNATPWAVGMPVAYAFLFRNLKMSIGEAAGMIAVIVLMDIIFFGTLMPLAGVALLFQNSPRITYHMVAVIMAVVAGGSLMLWALIRFHRTACRLLGRRMATVQWLNRRRYRLARTTVKFLRAFRILKKMSRFQQLALYLVTLGYWLPRYGILIVVVTLVGEKNVPFAYIFLVQGLLNLGGQVFVLPGGGGSVDVGYAALMSPYLGRETIAFTLLVWRAFTFYLQLIVGGPVFLFKTGKAARNLFAKKP